MRVKWCAVLFAVAVVLVLGTRRPRLPGTLGLMYARVHTGMTWDETAALLAVGGKNNTYEVFAFATLQDGSQFHKILWELDVAAMQLLPTAGQVAEGYIDVMDDDGRDLQIDFGPCGKVTGIRFESRSTWESYRHALSRLASK